jgi:hypothetical protein
MPHYGRYMGEKVTYPGPWGTRRSGTVTAIDMLDKNRVYVQFGDTTEPCVAEWCRPYVPAAAYEVIESDCLFQFTAKVNAAIAEGAKLAGGVSSIRAFPGGGRDKYLQAVTREIE